MTGAAGGEWASRGVPNSILLEKPFAPVQVVTAGLSTSECHYSGSKLDAGPVRIFG